MVHRSSIRALSTLALAACHPAPSPTPVAAEVASRPAAVPEVVVTASNTVIEFAVQDGRLFWVEAERQVEHAHVVMADPETGTLTDLLPVGAWDLGLAAGGGAIFVADAKTIYRIPTSGGSAQPYATAPQKTVLPDFAFDGTDVYREDHNHLLLRKAGATADTDLGSLGPTGEVLANAIVIVDGKAVVLHDDGAAPGYYVFDGQGGSTRFCRPPGDDGLPFDAVSLGGELYVVRSTAEDPTPQDADQDVEIWTNVIEAISLDGQVRDVWSIGRDTDVHGLVGNGRYLFAIAGDEEGDERLIRYDPATDERAVLFQADDVGTDLAVDERWVYLLAGHEIRRIPVEAPAA